MSSSSQKIVRSVILSAIVGGGLYFVVFKNQRNKNIQESQLSETSANSQDQSNQQTPPTSKEDVNSSSTQSSPSEQSNIVSNTTNSVQSKIEDGQLTPETAFSRAAFFKPVDWGIQFDVLQQKEKQEITFKPSCKSHKRTMDGGIHPAEWADAMTRADAQSRWPNSGTHVIDWNQNWQVGDQGIQISIRWNFEMPPRYSVHGYSFPLTDPDGYGTPLWPEKAEMSWSDARTFVIDWEKTTIDKGGKPGTRTMSLAEKPFDPSKTSTQDIERAEYANGRVRAAQTGKMICNSSPQKPEELSCSCTF